jgi:hypothetical protein
MKHYRYYMHKDARDCCIYPTTIIDANDEYFNVFAFWYNLGYTGKPWKIYAQHLNIKKKDFKDWIDITKLVKKPRQKPGLPT